MSEETKKSASTAAPPAVYYAPLPPPCEDDEIDLMEYWRTLMRHKAILITSVLVFTLAAVAAAFLMTPIYRAEVVVAPVSEEKGGGLSALAGQFGGLASLAGINLGGGGGKVEEAIAKLKSRAFTTAFIEEQGLMPVLFDELWDPAAKRWRVDSEDDIPTAWDAYKAFDEIRSISEDKKTGIITLAIEWKDAELAARWANALVARLNKELQREAIEEARKSIAYLEQQLEQTSVIEMRQSIFRLIEAQTKNIMLANVRDEFAFKIIDKAVPPEEKAKPKRKLMVALGLVLGLFVGIFLAFFTAFLKKQRETGDEAANAAAEGEA